MAGFLNVLEIMDGICMLSVVPADKKEMNSNRKYFQRINKHKSREVMTNVLATTLSKSIHGGFIF